MDLKVHFSRQLKAARAMRGMTQRQLAEETGIMQRMLSHYETGQWVTLRPDHLVAMADALDVSIDQLLGREVAHG